MDRVGESRLRPHEQSVQRQPHGRRFLGGEGAAVGCGGSPFGIGSDIAGSIRIPAFFCGVFGHKPSSGLVPNTGSYQATPGDDAGRMLVTGPLARRGEDLMPLLRLIAGPDGVDHLTRSVELGDPATVSLRVSG